MPRVPLPLRNVRLELFLVLMTLLAGTADAAPTLGFIEHFPGTSTGSWSNISTVLSNPGTGGVNGAGDGYLVISSGSPVNLGAMSNGGEYVGNWTAAGITQVSLWLNDIGAADPLEIHFGIGDAREGSGNFWQYNVGFIPPLQSWAQFTVDLNSSSAFTQIINTTGGTFADALANVQRILVRHDLAPYVKDPNTLAGDYGLDEILLTQGTTAGVDLPTAGALRPVQLAPPQPNPSRGPVAFALESDGAEQIRIEIVDVMGRVLRHSTLAAAAGPRIWTWDGADDSGARVAPGYYRVRAFSASGGTSRPFVRLGP
jgi:hypothetical protein